MPKRTSYEIKKEILYVIREKAYSMAELERKLNTGYRTIKSNCKELEEWGKVKMETLDRHPANGKPSYKVSLVREGREYSPANKK